MSWPFSEFVGELENHCKPGNRYIGTEHSYKLLME